VVIRAFTCENRKHIEKRMAAEEVFSIMSNEGIENYLRSVGII